MCKQAPRGAFAVPRDFPTRTSAVCWRPEAACARPPRSTICKKKEKKKPNTGLVWLLSAEKGGLGNVCIRQCIVSGRGGEGEAVDPAEVRQTSVHKPNPRRGRKEIKIQSHTDFGAGRNSLCVQKGAAARGEAVEMS